MTDYYVWHGGSDSATPNSWANARVSLDSLNTLLGAGGLASGDTIFIADDHSVVYTSGFAGSMWPTSMSGAPAYLLCVNRGTGLLSTGAYEAVNANASYNLANAAYNLVIYGCTFLGGTGTSSWYRDQSTNNEARLLTINCTFGLYGSHGSSTVGFGRNNTGSSAGSFIHINPTIAMGGNQNISLGQATRGLIYGLSWDTTNGYPTAQNIFVTLNSYRGTNWRIANSDCSPAATTGALFAFGTGGAGGLFRFENIKLSGSTTSELAALPASVSDPTEIAFYNVGTADRRNELYLVTPPGVVETEITKKLTTSPGADPESNAYSLLMAPSSFVNVVNPLRSPPLSIWNSTVGSSRTVTVKVAHDDATVLKDNELWLEVEYHGITGSPGGSFATTYGGVASSLNNPGANLTDTSENWDGSWTAKKTYSLTASFTPQEAGFITVRVCLAKDEDVYVNPVVTLS